MERGGSEEAVVSEHTFRVVMTLYQCTTPDMVGRRRMLLFPLILWTVQLLLGSSTNQYIRGAALAGLLSSL